MVSAIGPVEPGEPRLRAGVDAFLDFVEERRDAWRFVFLNVGDPEIADAVARLRDEVAGAIAGLMAAEAPPSGAAIRCWRSRPRWSRRSRQEQCRRLRTGWDERRDVPRERIFQSIMDFAWIGLERLGSGARWKA